MKKLYLIIVLLGLCVTAEAQPYAPRPPSVTSLALTGNSTSSYSGTASTPAFRFSGVPFAGTGTTSFPLVYVADANATASTTLNTAGTYFGVNGDGTQDLMNLLTDGISQFNFNSAGTFRLKNVIGANDIYVYTDGTSAMADTTANRNIDINGGVGIKFRPGWYVGWTSGDAAGSIRTSISENAAGVVQIGTTAANALGSLLLTNITIGGASGTQLKLVKSATATLDFTSTSAQTSSELTVTVTGAADGDDILISPPNGSNNANTCFTARVSSANTVSVKFNNFSSAAVDPASGTFRVTLLQF